MQRSAVAAFYFSPCGGVGWLKVEGIFFHLIAVETQLKWAPVSRPLCPNEPNRGLYLRFDILLLPRPSVRPSMCPVPYNTLNNLKEDDGEKGPPSNKIRHSESRKSWIQCQLCTSSDHPTSHKNRRREKHDEYASARRRQIYEQRDGTNRVLDSLHIATSTQLIPRPKKFVKKRRRRTSRPNRMESVFACRPPHLFKKKTQKSQKKRERECFDLFTFHCLRDVHCYLL